MRQRSSRWWVLVAAQALVLAGCESAGAFGRFVPNGDEASDGGFGMVPNGGGGTGGTGGQGAGCPCASGFVCEGNVCVPVERETNSGLGEAPPVATPRYVYALNPTASSVARIDPASLLIEAVTVGPSPVALEALPGEDAALVLSPGDGSLSLLDSRTLPTRVVRVPLGRELQRLTVSPDGKFAVAWPSTTAGPTSGAEGVFTLVDVAAVRRGAPLAQQRFERSGGYRITHVVFQTEAGAATKLHVFAKATVSTFDLRDTAAAPRRLMLPASMSADVSSREVAATADGRVIMLRSTTAPELASFDGVQLTVLALPAIATDLDLLSDGTGAVAALRSLGSVGFLPLPATSVDGGTLRVYPVADGGVGQVALPPPSSDAGLFAVTYSNVGTDEGYAKVDLATGQVTRVALEKWVNEISLSPDGLTAFVLHRANPSPTTTDPYEAAVDRDQGFSVVDLATGFWQLKRTGTTRPTRYAFSPRGGYLGVALRNDALKRHSLEAVNLTSLVTTSLPLSSTPLFMGTVPEAPSITPHRVFVSQEHPGGRISVIQLDTGQVRTATGFTLNGEIE